MMDIYRITGENEYIVETQKKNGDGLVFFLDGDNIHDEGLNGPRLASRPAQHC